MKDKNPLISIAVPTLNSEKTLKRTLESIRRQSYKNYEIIVVDGNPKGHSTDATLSIAKKYTNKIFQCRGKLLGARYVGLTKSTGKYHAFIDSDQVLERTAIERSVKMMTERDYDLLFLGEDSYNPKTIIEKLTSIDRKITHKKAVLDPSQSVLLPRQVNALRATTLTSSFPAN